MFWGTYFEGLKGFETIKQPGIDIFRSYMPDIAAFLEDGHGPVESVICVDKIEHAGSTYTEQWDFLKRLLPADKVRGAKLTLAAPEWYHMRYREGKAYPKSVYANDEEYFADIAKAYQTELQILYDHGLRNVQIDDPNFACMFMSDHRTSTVACLRSFRFLLRKAAGGLERRQIQYQIGRRDVGLVHQIVQ